MINYQQKLVEVHSNIPDKNSKIRKKLYYLGKMNLKIARKTLKNGIQKMEGNSTTVKGLFNSIEINYFWGDCSILLEFSQNWLV